jgi:acetyltransferase
MDNGVEQLVRLADGTDVVLRTISPNDASLLQAFVRRLSSRSRRFRFFVALTELSAAQLERLVNVDPARDLALVALSGRQEGTAIVAEARYAGAKDADNAEFAIAVADEFQGRGLGTHLVKRLLATARRRGVQRLFGEINVENRPMLAFARQVGFRLRISLHDHSVVIASMVSSTGGAAAAGATGAT